MSYQRFFSSSRTLFQFRFWISSSNICWLKLLKLRWCMFLLLFVLSWSIGRNRNWAKWSEIDVTMFPEIAFSDMAVEKILSIRVLECEVIRVGDVIWGTKEAEYIWSKKSAVLWSFSYFSKSMLKSPSKTISLFFSDSRFSLRVFKNRLLNSFTSIDGWR